MSAEEATTVAEKVTPSLQAKYEQEIKQALKERFGISNEMAVPALKKINVNMGVNGAVDNKARVDIAARDLATIAAQRPTIRNAKNAISGFHLREGMPIGCAVTLRRERMWHFAERLISVVIPRIRDFRGLKSKFDGRGNYTMGLSEQSIFPEIPFDRIEFQQGMDITFVTSAPNDEQGFALLKALGMPFRTEDDE
ncbi:MAG: 50S ribosomal protein L5 [Planctomycetes bacterium]|nr:50S ribosomal protein L5 [Planctomycetota bacterium]